MYRYVCLVHIRASFAYPFVLLPQLIIIIVTPYISPFLLDHRLNIISMQMRRERSRKLQRDSQSGAPSLIELQPSQKYVVHPRKKKLGMKKRLFELRCR